MNSSFTADYMTFIGFCNQYIYITADIQATVLMVDASVIVYLLLICWFYLRCMLYEFILSGRAKTQRLIKSLRFAQFSKCFLVSPSLR